MLKRDRYRRRALQSRRPFIPASCSCALTCVIGVLSSGPIAHAVDFRTILLIVAVGIVFLAFGIVILWKSRANIVLWTCLFFIVGILAGSLQYAELAQARATVQTGQDGYEFILEEDSQKSSYGAKATALVAKGEQQGKKVLLFFNERVRLFRGDVIAAQTRLEPPKEEYLEFYDKRGISFSSSIASFAAIADESALSVLHELRKKMLAIIGEGDDSQTLLRAILLGERSDLFDADFYHGIKVAGLAHLVAVSGAHLVIVTGFVTLLLRRFHLSRRVCVSIQTCFLLVYLVLVGFPASCIRAAIMSFLTMMTMVILRKPSSLTALGLTVLAMVMLDPCIVHQLSFQLSVAATLGIVLFMLLFIDWIAALKPKTPEFLRDSISMTVSALIFSLPLSIAQFATLPLLCPFANLIATPLLSLLLMIGFIALIFCSVAPWLLLLSGFFSQIACWLFEFFEMIPFASIPIDASLQIVLTLSLIGAAILWIVWPTPRKNRKGTLITAAISCVIVIVVALGSRFLPAGDRIVMLDVGQGDCFALQSGGKTVLVDTGNEPQMLYASLARNNIHHLDAIIITHPDDDHCGSLNKLAGIVDVDQVVIAKGLLAVKDEKVQSFLIDAQKLVGRENVCQIGRGDMFRFGSILLDVISPVHIKNEGGNEDSICFYARIDVDRDGLQDWSAFFCGDAEAQVLEALDDECMIEPVDIFKVGHHGSRKAITTDLAEALSPRVALIGVGKNTYGHPNDDTLEKLEEIGAQVYRSDRDGDVICGLSYDAIRFTTQR